MDKFNIAEYITIVRRGLKSSSAQGPAGILLLGEIGNLLSPRIDFDDPKISRLTRHVSEVHDDIIRAVSDINFVDQVILGFKTNVSRDFNTTTIDNVCLKLINLINNEPNLASTYKNELNTLYQSGDNATFLAKALVYAVGMTNTNESGDTTSDEVPYLTETSNHCPLCGKNLYKTVRGRNISDYEITKVFDDSFDEEIKKELETVYPAPSLIDSIENKIVLCTSCYSDYRVDPTTDKYKKLFDKKRSFEKNAEISSELNTIDIEDELYNIVNALGEFSKDQEGGLIPLDPSLLVDKIPHDVVLKDDVTKWVLRYYKFIEQQFSDLDATGKSRFNIIAHQVGEAFESLDALELLSQKKIFNRLSRWMADQIGYSIDKISVVNIVIAFFVQNCEVFHEIS